MESQLRSWAKSFDDRVRICTDVRHGEVPQYLNAMDVLVAPSQTTPQWREQFGRMLIEAFACGVPVVGSDSGEIPHVIGEAGIVVGERDEITWGHTLRDLLNSPARRKELAERGLARAPEYAWPAIARQYLQFFSELLDARAAAAH
jgi:glycosyltransferase involved in cell wall biosynthesis